MAKIERAALFLLSEGEMRVILDALVYWSDDTQTEKDSAAARALGGKLERALLANRTKDD
jgi:hypothetical protein